MAARAASALAGSVAARAASALAGSGSATAADPADRVVPAVLAGLSGDGEAGAATVLAAHRLLAPVAGWAMNLPADPLALRELRRRLRDWLRDLGVSLSDRTDVELAVWEAAVNATVHGRAGRGACHGHRARGPGHGRERGDPGQRPGAVAAAGAAGSGPEVARRAGADGHQPGRRRAGHHPGPAGDHGNVAPAP